MNTIKKSILVLLAILLLSISVSAADFDVEVEAIEKTISFGELAKFKLTVYNNMHTKETFKVKTLDYPTWEITTDPLLNPIQFTVNPDKKREVIIFLNPLHVSNYGVFDVNVIVELVSKKEKVQMPIRVNLVSPQAGTYIETVLATILMDDKIDPTKEILIRIKVDNQNVIEYPDLLVKVESSLINEEIEVSLGKKEKKTLPLTKSIDPQTPPQEVTVVVKVISNNKTLDTKVKRVEVIGTSEITKKEESRNRFLKTINEMTITNIGNAQHTEGIKIESSIIQNLFTSSRPKGKFIKEDGKRYLAIPLDIPPGETTTVIVTKNYITLVIIAVLIGILLMLYYVFRSPLTIRKTATNIGVKEGGVSELKIVLNVSNRSKNRLKDISVIDRIPNIADMEKGLTIGTLHPSKILKHEKKGTIIKWNIDALDAGDERVISYKIKSHLSILGEFSLTQAIAKFHFKGKEIVTHSNTLGISP